MTELPTARATAVNPNRAATNPITKKPTAQRTAIGIPMIVASLPISATVVGLPLGATLFTVGWGFQFLGHWFEGNDPAFFGDRRSLLPMTLSTFGHE